MEKIKEIILPSVLTGVFATSAYKFILKEDISEPINFLSYSTPAYIGITATVGLAAMASEFIEEIIVPHIPKLNNYQHIQDMIVPPTITGVTTYGAIKLINGADPSFKEAFLLGAGSNIAAKYISNAI